MHGPEQISKAFSEFCTHWGNFASVAGLLVSLLGFWLTIWGVAKAKGAAERAADAAKQAKEKILKQGTLANFSSAIAVIEEIVRLHRKKEWEVALDRHSELRRILVELKGDGGGLTTEQQTVIQGSVEQFKTIEGVIEKHLSAGKAEPRIDRLNEIAKGQLVKVHEIAISLKNS